MVLQFFTALALSASISFSNNPSYSYTQNVDYIHNCVDYNFSLPVQRINRVGLFNVSLVNPDDDTQTYNYLQVAMATLTPSNGNMRVDIWYDYTNLVDTDFQIGVSLSSTLETEFQYLSPSTNHLLFLTFNVGSDTNFDMNFSFTIIDSEQDSAYTIGYGTGYLTGYNNGLNEGLDTGFTNGYNNAMSTHQFTFTNLFASIADTPILMFRRLFNFDLFGVNLIGVFLSLFTALIVIDLVKRFFK